jgi:hypothetical protein
MRERDAAEQRGHAAGKREGRAGQEQLLAACERALAAYPEGVNDAVSFALRDAIAEARR